MTHTPVGSIGLECLMNRANILFTSGYRFSGQLDAAQLETSFHSIVAVIEKFGYQLQVEAQNRFYWQAAHYHPWFQLIDLDPSQHADPDSTFAAWCQNSLSLVESGQHCPMALCVIRDAARQEFIIAQTCEHTCMDARSAEVVFDLMVDHYNGAMLGDLASQAAAIERAQQIKTMAAAQMIALLAQQDPDGFDDAANLANLNTYPQADLGGYGIAIEQVGTCLEQFKQQRHAPIVQYFSIGALTRRCRQRYPQLTQNSVICAALAKGFYQLNRLQKNLPQQHIISFKMLSDLLKPELRQQYGGNYIAFVPVTVQGEQEIEEMALEIHQRIRHFKSSKLDLSIFKLTEAAVDACLVGQADEPLSFVVTNWTNYRFLNRPAYLHGCQSLRHQSGVNLAPRDTLGAALVNRPVAVINMSPNDELCLSFFPSLRTQQESHELMQQIRTVID